MNYPPVQYDSISMKGGMDQVTPTLALPSGYARRAANFECSITGGYTRIAGYERYDGHARPSDATYTILNISLTGAAPVGSLAIGASSGASGTIVYSVGGKIVVTRVSGQFRESEPINVGGSLIGVTTSTAGADVDGFNDATYNGLAADNYRASITAVPGSGATLGVAYYNGKLYAWRNSLDGTAALMYVESATGWKQILFGEEIAFTNANTAVVEGATVTSGGVTATISRMVVATGSLLSGVNTGRMVITARYGGSFSAGAATSGGSGTLTLSGPQVQISLLPGGSFDTQVANFGAGSANKRLYCADGKNSAFEFDGTNLVFIKTGMTVDTPSRVVAHKQHLFLVFDYSLQFSGTGTPFIWTPVLGAGELAMNDSITNVIALPGDQTNGALGIFTKGEVAVLYGTGASSFSLSSFNVGSGAHFSSAQNMDQSYFVNEQGVVSMNTTKNFGNFLPASLTMNLRPFFKAHLKLISGSGLNREKGQYRVFFSDGYGLYVTIRSGEYLGAMPVQYPNPVVCYCEGQNASGLATNFFGSSNGMVYEMDVGTSFDGAVIAANFSLVFTGKGNHRMLKRYRKASVEATGDSYASFDFGYDMGYLSTEIEQGVDATVSNDLRSAFWDEFTWDGFVWDGKGVSPTEAEMLGTAENVSFHISSVSAILKPYTVNSITVHYTTRRGIR